MTDPTDPTDSTDSTEPAPAPTPWAEAPGRSLVIVDAAATALLAASTVVVSVAPGNGTNLANLIVSIGLLLGGMGLATVGFLLAVGRSRTHVISLAGLFYLTGSAPRSVRRRLLGLWFVQIAVAAASVVTVHPPFGVLAPLFGIGMLTLWGARHGQFPERVLEGRAARRSRPQ